jgi:hypothetical protein
MAFRRSPVRSRSGPPSFAHECRRRMPRRSGEAAKAGLSCLRTSFGSANHSSLRRSVRHDAPARAARILQSIAGTQIAETDSGVARIHCLCAVRRSSGGGTAVAFAVGCRKKSASSTCSRVSIPNPITTLASPTTSPPVSPTTTPAAALTPPDTGPGQLHVIVELSDERRALDFERYRKSGSGRAFARRHFG